MCRVTSAYKKDKLMYICVLTVFVHLQARDGRCSVWSQGSRAEVSAQQRIEWGAAGGVGGLPVSLKILSQVLTCIFQLILIQDDIKHFLIKVDTYAHTFETDVH